MSAAVHMGHPAAISHPAAVVSPQPDELMMFGFLAVFLAMILFLHRHHSPAAELGFAGCLVATACYGFAAGSWPLGVIQLVFAGSSVRNVWFRRSHKSRMPTSGWVHRELYESESRISRMFGSA